MDDRSRANQLAAEAGAFWRQGRWTEARQCYEEILSLTLSPEDRAKMLANLMQMYEKEGNIEQAMATAWQVFDIIQAHDLASTLEGAHLRGYVRGFIMRLQGVPVEVSRRVFRQFLVELFACYVIGATMGAAIGSKIPAGELTIAGMAQTDLRYVGAVVGAILGWFAMPYLRSLASRSALTVGGLVNFALLCWLLTEVDRILGIGLLAFVLLAFFIIQGSLRLLGGPFTPKSWGQGVRPDITSERHGK